MTLIVSLSTPDGIVIAGDSLSTMMSNKLLEADFIVQCQSCQHSNTFRGRVPNVYSSNTLSHAQKILPFLDKYAVGTFGLGQILGKSIYFILREFEASLVKKHGKGNTIDDVAQHIGSHIQMLLLKQIRQETQNPNLEIQDGAYPIGFQIVGYDKDNPHTIEMHVGKDLNINKYNDLRITYTGQVAVVNTLFARFDTNPEERPVFQCFSLQDAIIYAEYLIKTTEIYQRFSSNMATVGGEIDIALVTPFDNFKWIKRKSLQAKLFGDIYAEHQKY